MALTQEEKNKIKADLQRTLQSDSQPVSRMDRIKSIVSSTTSTLDAPKTGFVEDIKGIGTDIGETFQKRGQAIGEISQSEQSGSQGFLRSAFQKLGQVAGGASDVIGSVLMGGVKALTPQPVQEKVGETVQAGVEKVIDTQTAQDLIARYNSLDDASKKDLQAIGGILSLVTDVTGAGLAKKPVVAGVKKGVEVATDVAQATGKKIASAAGDIASPEAIMQRVARVNPTEQVKFKDRIPDFLLTGTQWAQPPRFTESLSGYYQKPIEEVRKNLRETFVQPYVTRQKPKVKKGLLSSMFPFDPIGTTIAKKTIQPNGPGSNPLDNLFDYKKLLPF